MKPFPALLLAALVSATLFSVPAASEGRDFTDSLAFLGEGVFYLNDSATIDSDDATELRNLIDADFGNGDGWVTGNEVDEYTGYTCGKTGSTFLFTMDGRTGTFTKLNMTVTGAEGAVSSTEPVRITSFTRFNFDQSGGGEHTFVFIYSTQYSGDPKTNFTFTVPEGWNIVGAKGLENKNIKGNTLTGEAPMNANIVITFTREGPWDNIFQTPFFIVLLILIVAAAGILIALKVRGK